MASPKRYTIVVDWDGTCVEGVWPKEGDWMPGAVDALRYLSTFCRLVVFSCRTAPVQPFPGHTGEAGEARDPAEVQREINYIRRMLDEAGLMAVEIHDHTKPYKPGAVAYVDDKAVHYNGRKNAWTRLVPKLAILAHRPDMAFPENHA